MRSPIALKAPAVMAAMKPALRASPRLPLVTPVTNAAARMAHGAPQMAAAAICSTLPRMGTERNRFCTAWKIDCQKQPRKQ